MKLFKSEDKRRLVNFKFDTEPTYIHIFNFESSKKFIRNKIVLDIGCWTGQLEKLAHKSAKKIVALDPSPEAISFARKNLSGVDFKVGKANKLPFPDSYFDTVLLMDVIEHVPKGSEEEVLRQIYKVLKPGGILIISTPNKHPISILLDPAYFLIKHRHYSIEDIHSMLTKTGFKIKKKRVIGNAIGLMYSNISLFFKHSLGFEPGYLKSAKNLLLSEHSKNGFAFVFVIAEAKK